MRKSKFITHSASPVAFAKQGVKRIDWQYRRATRRQRALPDALIIGAQKSATTFLYAEAIRGGLVQKAFTKETHFLDRNWAQGKSGYRAYFSLVGGRIQRQGRMDVDATPYYLFYPRAAERAAQVIPEAHIIVILRDPVARAYSHYWHEVRKGREERPPEAALCNFNPAVARAHDAIRGGDINGSLVHQQKSYLERSLYMEQLRVWLHFFPKSSIHGILYEDLIRDPRTELQKLANAFDLPAPKGQARPMPRNQNEYPPIDSQLAKQMRHLLEADAHETCRMFEWSPKAWNLKESSA